MNEMLNKTHKGEAQIKEKAAAILTINDADKMTPAGRKHIADWLRRQAAMITRDGDNYAPRFRGRYLYTTAGDV